MMTLNIIFDKIRLCKESYGNYGNQKSTMVIIEVDVAEFILSNLENN